MGLVDRLALKLGIRPHANQIGGEDGQPESSCIANQFDGLPVDAMPAQRSQEYELVGRRRRRAHMAQSIPYTAWLPSGIEAGDVICSAQSIECGVYDEWSSQ